MSTYNLTYYALSRKKYLMGVAFIVGGLLWIAGYVQVNISDSLVDKTTLTIERQLPFFQMAGLYLFALLILGLNIGLGGLLVQIQDGENLISKAALFFMVVAVGLVLLNSIALSDVSEMLPFNHALTSFSISATAVALGCHCITISKRTLPLLGSLMLLLISVTTIPTLLIATPLINLNWANNQLVFLGCGLLYAFSSAGIWAAEP